MRFRTLPPVAGNIDLRAVLGSLFASDVRLAPLALQLSEQTGLKHWTFTNSGRSALAITLMVLKKLYPDRDEVVIPAFTSYSVPAAVMRAGMRVRLCDVETETLGLCPKELGQVLTPRTLCVVPNHLYGIPCQIREVAQVAADRNIPIIEDAAQGMGLTIIDTPGGRFGTAAIFSLSRGKTLSGAGGGLIGTNDDGIASKCRQLLGPQSKRVLTHTGLREFIETTFMAAFIHPSRYWIPASLPFLRLGASIYDPAFKIMPMSRFQEDLASRLLMALDSLTSLRHAQARRLRASLSEIDKSHALSVIWPKEEQGEKGSFLRLPILISPPALRTQVLNELQNRGLGASGGYPLPVCEIPELKTHLVGGDREFPVARRICRQLVTLPTHPWVVEGDNLEIVEVFKQCLR